MRESGISGDGRAKDLICRGRYASVERIIFTTLEDNILLAENNVSVETTHT